MTPEQLQAAAEKAEEALRTVEDGYSLLESERNQFLRERDQAREECRKLREDLDHYAHKATVEWDALEERAEKAEALVELRDRQINEAVSRKVAAERTAAESAARPALIAEWVREVGVEEVLRLARARIEEVRECGDLSHEILEIDKLLARIKAAKEGGA